MYEIFDTPISVDFPLSPFTIPAAQPDYGCPTDTSYTLEFSFTNALGTLVVSDSSVLTWVTLDASVPKITISLNEPAYAATGTFRLTYNGVAYSDFTLTGCYVN